MLAQFCTICVESVFKHKLTTFPLKHYAGTARLVLGLAMKYVILVKITLQHLHV